MIMTVVVCEKYEFRVGLRATKGRKKKEESKKSACLSPHGFEPWTSLCSIRFHFAGPEINAARSKPLSYGDLWLLLISYG